MRPRGPTSWLLDGRTGWKTAPAGGDGVRPGVAGVGVGRAGIRLAADPAGPLGLTSGDGSLGRLVLPRGMAFDDEWTLYLLAGGRGELRRFDPERGRFVTLAGFGPRATAGSRSGRAGIAVASDRLYVADGEERRVRAFDVRTLARRYAWDEADVPPGTGGEPWRPIDVAAQAGSAYILDAANGRVFRHAAGSDRLVQVVGGPATRDRAGRWSRIAVDREGRIHLLDTRAGRLDVFDPSGRPLAPVADAGEARDRFEPPAIVLDERGNFCLAPGLTALCDRRPPATPPSPTVPLAPCLACDEGALLFDRDGERVAIDPAQAQPAPLYGRTGVWISERLDSDIFRCQWHRIELELADLPGGTRLEVGTFASDEPLEPATIAVKPRELWQTRATFAGVTHARPGTPRFDPKPEFLVQSRPGQYLWLRIELSGDGYGTPVLTRLRVHYPRDSYLRYLPAVFAEDEESRWFLERFLAIVQTEWDDLERRIGETSATLADPAAVPDAFVGELAKWLALPLEGEWDTAQQRRLLGAAPKLAPRRGTRDGLRDYLRLYLENITGRELQAYDALPMIVEGFRERNHLLLGMEDAVGLPLWGPAVAGRAQLGVNARAGEGRLVSTGDPERDLFHHYAHTFQVFVPAAWVPTAKAERMVRRALDEEKPAHTRYDLCLVEPRFQVGLQSTVGLDTFIGDYPVARLACATASDGDPDTAAPPSRQLPHRLGYDMVLAGAAGDDAPIRLDPGMRVGVATTAR